MNGPTAHGDRLGSSGVGPVGHTASLAHRQAIRDVRHVGSNPETNYCSKVRYVPAPSVSGLEGIESSGRPNGDYLRPTWQIAPRSDITSTFSWKLFQKSCFVVSLVSKSTDGAVRRWSNDADCPQCSPAKAGAIQESVNNYVDEYSPMHNTRVQEPWARTSDVGVTSTLLRIYT